MPAVFVHGNPETAALWGPLLDALDRDDSVCLSPPGFGAPVPDGFGATREEYAEWLVGELGAIDGPIDLVGHDWGAGHVLGALDLDAGLVRSWCVDGLGLAHPEYVWHDLAQVWRTPGAGEEAVGQMTGGDPGERATFFEALGMTAAVARDIAAAGDATMAECILKLYRSADEADLRALGDRLAATDLPAGLALIARDDPYVGSEAMVREQAERLGAGVSVLEGVGHWWMCQDPAAGAAALQAFWAGLS